MTPIFETVDVILHTENACEPTRTYEYDGGNDLYADCDGVIKAGSLGKVSTGVSLAIPEGAVGLIKDRSSMGKRGLHVFSGVIDSGYCGEVGVLLYNSSAEDYAFVKGDRVAQLLIIPVVVVEWNKVKTPLPSSMRGKRGWGSSGA